MYNLYATRACINTVESMHLPPSAPPVCYKLTPKLNEFEMIDKLYH